MEIYILHKGSGYLIKDEWYGRFDKKTINAAGYKEVEKLEGIPVLEELE